MIFLLFSGKFVSQTERYIYLTEVNPDTINLVNMKVENTFLDIKNNQSLFISESKLLRDSLTNVLRQQGITEIKKSKKDKSEFPKLPNGKSIQPTFFDYFIIKNREDKSVNFVESIGSKQVYYQEDRKWIGKFPAKFLNLMETKSKKQQSISVVEIGQRGLLRKLKLLTGLTNSLDFPA